MKKLIIFLLILFFSGGMYAAQLSYRFANPRIIRLSAIDHLQFDVQVKCDVAGTYLWASTIKFSFNNATFNTSANNWVVTKIGEFSGSNSNLAPKYNITKTITGTAPNKVYNIAVTGDVNVFSNGPGAADFVEMPTSWTTIITVSARLLVATGDALAGLDFFESGMNGATTQKYITGPSATANYANPSNFTDNRDFLLANTGRFYSTTYGWSQIGGGTNDVQYNNWATNVSTTVWEDGSVDQTDNTAALVKNLVIGNGSASYPVLTVPANKWLTVSGTLASPATTSLVVKSGGSLIQNAAVPATVERDIAAWGIGALAFHGWHLLSSPVTTQAIAPAFTTATPANYDFYAWWEATGQWVNYKNTITAPTWSDANSGSLNFIPGNGYLVEYLAASTRQFAGTLNNADITFNNLSKGSLTYKGFHLLGNPFTSALRWNDGNWGALTNVVGTAKVWDDASASYLPINASGMIPALSGFMVEVTSATNSIKIPLASRVHDAAAWYKASDGSAIILVAKDPTGQTAQGSIVRFENEATKDFDPSFDSHFLAGFAPQFYSVMSNEKLSTNTLPELTSETVIPFDFIKNTSTNFSIEAQGIESLGTGATVYLWDNKSGAKHNLSLNPVYTFASAEGDAAARFELHFSTTYGINETTNPQPINIYSASNTVYVAIKTAGSVKGEVYVYNTLGQVMAHQYLSGDLTKINITAATGYYMVKVITADRTITGKVLVKQQ